MSRKPRHVSVFGCFGFGVWGFGFGVSGFVVCVSHYMSCKVCIQNGIRCKHMCSYCTCTHETTLSAIYAPSPKLLTPNYKPIKALTMIWLSPRSSAQETAWRSEARWITSLKNMFCCTRLSVASVSSPAAKHFRLLFFSQRGRTGGVKRKKGGKRESSSPQPSALNPIPSTSTLPDPLSQQPHALHPPPQTQHLRNGTPHAKQQECMNADDHAAVIRCIVDLASQYLDHAACGRAC